jgi:hypothetical protein
MPIDDDAPSPEAAYLRVMGGEVESSPFVFDSSRLDGKPGIRHADLLQM